jgi:hypothetical protein
MDRTYAMRTVEAVIDPVTILDDSAQAETTALLSEGARAD